MRRLSLYLSMFLLVLPAFFGTAVAQELRVLVHNSFSLPKPLLAQFEAQSGVKLSIIKAGDAGELLNKIILTRAQPIGDVVFGLDNALLGKAHAANVLEPYNGPVAQRTAAVTRHAAVGINDNFTTGKASITDRTTNDKFASWIDMIACTGMQ